MLVPQLNPPCGEKDKNNQDFFPTKESAPLPVEKSGFFLIPSVKFQRMEAGLFLIYSFSPLLLVYSVSMKFAPRKKTSKPTQTHFHLLTCTTNFFTHKMQQEKIHQYFSAFLGHYGCYAT